MMSWSPLLLTLPPTVDQKGAGEKNKPRIGRKGGGGGYDGDGEDDCGGDKERGGGGE